MSLSHWLVKSGGRILGPLSNEEVIRSLRTREIVPLDEISQSFGRWHYIRDEKIFEPVVYELRSKKSNQESTVTETDITATDITERLSAFGPTDRLTANITDQLNDSKENNESDGAGRDKETLSNTYGYVKDKGFSSKSLPRTNIFIWIALIVVIGGISVKVLMSRNTYLQPSAIEMAKRELLVGNYSQALPFFRESLSQIKNDPTWLLNFSGALLELKQSSEAKKILETILSSGANNQQKSKALTGLAIASTQDYDYTTARERLKEALVLEPENAEVYANMGAINLFESRFDEAAQSFLEAIKKGSLDPMVSIQSAEASFLSSRAANNTDGILKSKAALDTVIETKKRYRQEALAYRIYISIETKDKDGLLTLAEKFLNFDPQFSDDHIKNAYLVHERVEWDHISKYLKTASTEINKTPRLMAVLGLTMFKGKEKLEGKKIIEDAQSKAPEDNLIRAVLSYVQFQVGREEEGAAGLTLALASADYTLPLLLKARWCRERKDYLCEEEFWKKLLQADESSVAAMAGLAWTHIDKGRKLEAQSYLMKGFSLDPFYIPLLKAERALKGLP